MNKDGSLLLLLEAGPNQGVNYFVPETGELVNVLNSWPEESNFFIKKPVNLWHVLNCPALQRMLPKRKIEFAIKESQHFL